MDLKFFMKKSILFTLMAVIFIDGLGQGILFPILTRISLQPHSSLWQYSNTQWVYGAILGVFFFFAFIGTAVLGDLSDYVGRKKTLIICLLGSVIGFVFMAVGFQTGSLSLIIIGRSIDGFTAGSQSIANARLIDSLKEPSEKPRYMGYILLAVSLGIISGPLIGVFLSNSQLNSWFTNSTPLWFAAFLALINIVFLIFFLPKQNQHKYILLPISADHLLRE
jgi:MFS transporter, DHA1 family, tetracycline resistance protein